MNPYDICDYTKERLKKYQGFEGLSEEELDMAIMVMATMTTAYLNNRDKINEYARSEFGAFQRIYETQGDSESGSAA